MASHLSIRRARPEEAAALSDLAFRSKAHWGYDAAFMAACRADLSVSPDQLAAQPYHLVERDGQTLGFYHLIETARGAQLQHLFVSPQAIGSGLGKALWQHMLGEARRQRYDTILIDSDPNAEPFYLAMGAERIGTAQSSVFPDRRLPLLRYRMRDDAPR